jgi:hypothetical protein
VKTFSEWADVANEHSLRLFGSQLDERVLSFIRGLGQFLTESQVRQIGSLGDHLVISAGEERCFLITVYLDDLSTALVGHVAGGINYVQELRMKDLAAFIEKEDTHELP